MTFELTPAVGAAAAMVLLTGAGQASAAFLGGVDRRSSIHCYVAAGVFEQGLSGDHCTHLKPEFAL